MMGMLLSQMWDLFHQYLSELKTVAVSYKVENAVEFPSFAFCDSTAFTKRIGVIANATQYNDSALNVEVEVSVYPPTGDNLTVQTFPTTDNGYCTNYDLYGEYPLNTFLSNGT